MTLLSLEALADEARSSLQRGYGQHALELARHILTRYPRAVEAYRLMGRACVELAQWHEAADLYKRVLGVDPEDWQAYAGLGLVYRNQGAPDEAIWHLERALEIDPTEVEVERTLLRLYQERDGRRPEAVPLTRGALGRIYLRGRLFSYAIRELQSVVEEDPERMDLEAALAEALWRSGQSVEAAEVCRSLLQRLPNCLKANLILGNIWRQAGLEKEAEALFERARAVDPTNRRALDLLGEGSPLPVQEAPLAPPQWRMEDRIPGGDPTPGAYDRPPPAQPRAAEEPAAWPDLGQGGERTDDPAWADLLPEDEAHRFTEQTAAWVDLEAATSAERSSPVPEESAGWLGQEPAGPADAPDLRPGEPAGWIDLEDPSPPPSGAPPEWVDLEEPGVAQEATSVGETQAPGRADLPAEDEAHGAPKEAPSDPAPEAGEAIVWPDLEAPTDERPGSKE